MSCSAITPEKSSARQLRFIGSSVLAYWSPLTRHAWPLNFYKLFEFCFRFFEIQRSSLRPLWQFFAILAVKCFCFWKRLTRPSSSPRRYTVLRNLTHFGKCVP